MVEEGGGGLMDEWSVGSDGWVMERDGSLPKVKGKGNL